MRTHPKMATDGDGESRQGQIAGTPIVATDACGTDTDGPSRTVKIGPTTIQLRRTTARNMAAAGRLSGLLIQALREVGKDHVTPARIRQLKRTLPADKRHDLLNDIKLAPAWMHPIFRELANEDARNSFLELPPDERCLYTEQAALRRNVSPTFLKLPEAGASRNQAHRWMTRAPD